MKIFKQRFSSTLTIIGLFVLMAFLADWKYKQWQNENLIEKQKLSLQQQADSLQKKNNDLSQSLDYLNSDNFKEGVARQQLNLKKQGEQVYTFADAPDTAKQTDVAANSGNAKKWLDYFFSN